MKRLIGFSLILASLSPLDLAADGLPTVDPAEAGMRGEHLRRMDAPIEAAIQAGDFAGCVVAIGRGEWLVELTAFGDRQIEPARLPMQTDTLFDLASLTKPIATATSVMLLVERGKLRLGDPIVKHLPEVQGEHGNEVTIERLLTHHTGYVPDNPLEDYRHGVDEAWRRLFALEPRQPPGTAFVYSDVNFELLGKIVERVDGRPLDQFTREELFVPLAMKSTRFNPSPEQISNCAATERRDGVMLVGEVHDPRSALLNGVAGHAGLFSTACDLARYAAMMLGRGELDGVRVLGPATVSEMTRRRDVSGAGRGAGWDMRSPYSSNRGDLFSQEAFGHGGFTGTAIWIDPGLDLFVIVLSNRLHPDGSGTVNHLAGRIGTIAAASILEE